MAKQKKPRAAKHPLRKAKGSVLFDCGGKACAITKRPAGARAQVELADFKYTTTGTPCGSARTGCPVQLIYKQGKPLLRFCTTKNRPGHVIHVKDAKSAASWAKKACQDWEKNGRRFTSDVTTLPLGGARAKPKRRFD